MKHNKKRLSHKFGRFGIQRSLLDIVFRAGVLSALVLAPKAVKVLSGIPGVRERLGLPYRIERAINTLIRGGDIEIVVTPKGKFFHLTEKGKEKLARLALANVRGTRRRWDMRWRVVLYDIHEKRRIKRQMLCMALKEIGFYRLQDSVWIYPHECAELVLLLRTNYALGREVHYMIVDHLENEKILIQHFSKILL